MPSHLHEAYLQLFLNNSRFAPELLERLRADVSDYSEVRIESANLTDLKPTEYRADHVLLLVRESRPAGGIIVEIQLSIDRDKQYTWPAYVANLRARIRCPVYLLVITDKDTVARWASKPIELGGGSRIVQWVMGPANTPAVTDLQQAQGNVELAVLSAVVHGKNADIKLASQIANTALEASKNLDPEQWKMYVDLIWRSLSEGAKALSKRNPMVYEYVSDFARRNVAEGKTEGRAEIVLRLLTLRFGPLTDAIQTQVQSACSRQASHILDGLLTAETLDDALSYL